ncbi:MAG: hypothetical protein WCK58_12705 [Chloroflexota bacterium]
MEMLVATWTIRLTLLGMLIVGWLSWSTNPNMIDVVIRVGLTAFILTFAGRQLMGWLETPEQKVYRMRAKRAKTLAGEK